ncbi:MAG: tetratricopeptide repeat protein [Azospirillaceae bacterium]|nr:tetratricopeptide repeat protein [Azospirillaceae bacterium]
MDEAGVAYAHLAAQPGLDATLAADAENGLGLVARHKGQFDEAAAHWHRAATLDPTYVGPWSNLGNMRVGQAQWHAARAALDRALALDPAHGGARMDMALCLRHLGDIDGAEAALRQVLAQTDAKAQLATDARFNLARLLLLRGPSAEAWDLHEARWRASSFPSVRRSFPLPVWQGDSLLGRTLLLWGEQGLGDEILFASQVPDLAAGLSDSVRAAGTRVMLECDARLVPLFARSFPAVTVVGRPKDNDGTDPRTADATAQLPTGSLARFCRPSLNRFGGARPFLKADPAKVAFWSDRLAALGPGLKVGLCWTSGLITADRAGGYTTLASWLPLARLPGVHLVNLQYNRAAVATEMASAQGVGMVLADWPDLDLRDDLDGVAALIAALDLVVTAATSVGEMAAALGTPTWRLSNPKDDWSALGTRVRPWYPAMRVAAPAPGESAIDIITRLVKELAALATPPNHPALPSLADALALHQAGRANEAEAAYRRLLAEGPQAGTERGDALHLLGLLLHQAGRPADAEPLLRQAVTEDFGFAQAWNSLGAVLLALGQRDAAADAWRTALRLEPGYDKPAANLARLGV